MLKIFMLALALIGCGPQPLEIDRDLEPILNLYLAYAPDRGHLKDVSSVRFGELPEHLSGKCDGKKKKLLGATVDRMLEIVIRREDALDNRFRAVVLHEFGHCLHDLPHSDDPLSIMSANIVSDEDYWRENLEIRLSEMFGRQDIPGYQAAADLSP